MDNKIRPVGIIDLGIGGMSIFDKLYHSFPEESFVFYGDNKNTGISEKDKDTVKKYLYDTVNSLVEEYDIKSLVIACNTLSVHSNFIQTIFPNISVQGVIEPTIEYLLKNPTVNKEKNVGLLATTTTVDSKVYDTPLSKAGIEVISLSCRGLADQIDNYFGKEEYIKPYVDKFTNQFMCLTKIKGRFPSIITLGCTHYPLVKDLLHNAFKKEGYVVDLFDPADAIVDFLKENLMKSNCSQETNLNQNNFIDLVFTNKNCLNSVEAILSKNFSEKDRMRFNVKVKDTYQRKTILYPKEDNVYENM